MVHSLSIGRVGGTVYRAPYTQGWRESRMLGCWKGIRAVGNNMFQYLTDPCTERDSPQ